MLKLVSLIFFELNHKCFYFILFFTIDIKTITPAAISRVRGRSSKLIIRLSVKTINGYKAIARKGKTAQEVFISTDLSKDELKQIIDIINSK